MVWSLALRSDDAKQDPVVYGTTLGVVFLAGGPSTASIQRGFDCFGLYHPGLERERDFRLAYNSLEYRLMRIQHARVRLAISTDISAVSVTAPLR